jgi:hypothetical protein
VDRLVRNSECLCKFLGRLLLKFRVLLMPCRRDAHAWLCLQGLSQLLALVQGDEFLWNGAAWEEEDMREQKRKNKTPEERERAKQKPRANMLVVLYNWCQRPAPAHPAQV